MPPVTYKDLSSNINIDSVVTEARKTFESEEARRQTLPRRIVKTLPVMMVVTAGVFYALSAPHTAHILDSITPGWGFIAPIGFEFGVLTVAAVREAGWKNALTAMMLYGLLIVAIVINWAGGFIAIVTGLGTVVDAETNEAIDVGSLTVTALFDQYGTLPAVGQVALILVGIIGVLIPVAGMFFGEAVIKFAMNRIALDDYDSDSAWVENRRAVVYKALLSAALEMSAGTRTAGAWASKVVKELYPEDDFLDAQSRSEAEAPVTPSAAAYASTDRRELGFAGLSKDNGDRTTGTSLVPASPGSPSAMTHREPFTGVNDITESPGTNFVRDNSADRVPRLTSAKVEDWLREGDNIDRFRDMTNEEISIAITGAPNGYKTVQRTIKKLNLRK